MLKSTLAVAALTAAAIVGSTAHSPAAPAPQGHPLWEQRHACADESSVNCFWNADTMGNGRGHSYVVRYMPGPRGKRITCVLYTNRADAHWDYCS